jgi:symplekin
MAAPPPSSAGAGQQMAQLNHARNLALADETMYSKVLPVILPILHAHNNPSPEVRAWGADFLAETFSSTLLPSDVKQSFSVQALPLLMEFLQLPPGAQVTPVEQTGMTKSAIQAAASVYPLVFRHM